MADKALLLVVAQAAAHEPHPSSETVGLQPVNTALPAEFFSRAELGPGAAPLQDPHEKYEWGWNDTWLCTPALHRADLATPARKKSKAGGASPQPF